MHLFLIAATLFSTPSTPFAALAANAGVAQAQAPAAAQAAAVRVPVHPNSTCPIMGKPISLKLFTDTELGRIWVCCKGCIADIQDDVELAYRTAYPTVREVAAQKCPVTGRPLRAESPVVELQGLRFRVFDDAAARVAREHSQRTLARVVEPNLVEVGNAVCPIDGRPVSANAIAVIEGRIVGLSSPKHVEELSKDPSGALKRALASVEGAR